MTLIVLAALAMSSDSVPDRRAARRSNAASMASNAANASALAQPKRCDTMSYTGQ